MILYGQKILGPDGSVSVSNCVTRQQAIECTTALAISSGWAPPKWWQLWIPPWPEECCAEYQRQCTN
jgi:hypothetical protein